MGTEENVSSHQPVLATGTWFEHVPRKPDVRPPAKRWNIQETTTATSGRLPLLTFIIEDSWQVTRKLKIPHPRNTICSIGIFNKQPPLLREDYRYLLSLRIQKVSGGQTSGLQRTCFGQSKTTWTKSGIELGAPSSQTFPCFPITVHGVQLLKINIRVSKPLARCLWPSVTNGQWFRAENGKLRRLRGKSGILGRCYLWMRSNVSWRHRKKPWILLSQWMLFASLVTSHIFTGTIKVNHKERVSNRWSNQSYATFPLVSLIKHLDFMGNWNHKSHRRASSLDFHWIPLEFIKVHSTPTHPSTATACKSAAVLSPKWPGTQRMNQPIHRKPMNLPLLISRRFHHILVTSENIIPTGWVKINICFKSPSAWSQAPGPGNFICRKECLGHYSPLDPAAPSPIRKGVTW